MRTILLLFMLLAPTALAVEIRLSPCGSLEAPPEPCVGWRELAKGRSWSVEVRAGAYIATSQTALDLIVAALPPEMGTADFEREFVVVLIEDQGTPSDIGVLDVVSPSAGSYTVGYYSVWGPSDSEYGWNGYHVAAISREAGAPTDVRFVGPYSVWDPRFDP